MSVPIVIRILEIKFADGHTIYIVHSGYAP